MAVSGHPGMGFTWTLESASDLRSHQYKLLAIDSNKRVLLCGDRRNAFIGVLQNKPNSLEFATVMLMGVTKAVAGEALTYGDLVTVRSGFAMVGRRAVPDTNTQSGDAAITNADSGTVLVGISLSNPGSGAIGEILLKGLFSIVNSN